MVGTEMGLIYALQKENPAREFHAPTEYRICPTMKMTTLQRELSALETMAHVVTVPTEIRAKASEALDAMLAVS
jgi:quinolinate synthase